MNEYIISFINDDGVYQQLTFRGVTESVATALASGMLAAGFDQVGLSAKEFVDREIAVLPGVTNPVPDPVEAAGEPDAETDTE